MPISRSKWSGRHSTGCVGQAHQRGGLAAADLRADRARQQAVPAGRARGLEQQVAGGQRAGAAAADDRDRDIWRFRHARRFRDLHLLPWRPSRACVGCELEASRRNLVLQYEILDCPCFRSRHGASEAAENAHPTMRPHDDRPDRGRIRVGHAHEHEPVRWMMTGQGEPLVPAKFETPVPGPGRGRGRDRRLRRLPHRSRLLLRRRAHQARAAADARPRDQRPRRRRPAPNALWWIDRAVIVPAVIPCGHCDACRRGKATICPNQKMPGNDIHGGFATHIVVPARGLCAVDETRLAGGRPRPRRSLGHRRRGDHALSGGRSGRRRAAAISSSSTASAASAATARRSRRAFGGTWWSRSTSTTTSSRRSPGNGAALTLNARQMSAARPQGGDPGFAKERGLRQTEWIIFECSGTRAGQETAFGLLNHGATLCVVGFTMDKVEVRLSNLMAFHARALGNWGCPPELYPEALDLVLERPRQGRRRSSRSIRSATSIGCSRRSHDGELKRRAVLVPATLRRCSHDRRSRSAVSPPNAKPRITTSSPSRCGWPSARACATRSGR